MDSTKVGPEKKKRRKLQLIDYESITDEEFLFFSLWGRFWGFGVTLWSSFLKVMVQNAGSPYHNMRYGDPVS